MDKSLDTLEGFVELFLSIKDKKLLFSLLDFFLTPEEKKDLAKRFLITKELIKKEKTQREIAKDLNVSIAKITRGSNELKRLNPKSLAFLKRMLKN